MSLTVSRLICKRRSMRSFDSPLGRLRERPRGESGGGGVRRPSF